MIDPPPQIQEDKDNQNNDDHNMIDFEEEEEEGSENQVQSNEIVEVKTVKQSLAISLADENTQTESSVFAKIQDNSSKQNSNSQSHSFTQTEIMSVQIDNDRDQYDKFMEREFYPQFKANEEKIDSQIEKIDDAIAKLRFLTNNFNNDIEATPSTSTSASIDHLSESLQINLKKKAATPKKSIKKTKVKATVRAHSKPVTPISKVSVQDADLKKKTRKKNIKRHKRFLSPLKMTTEKRLEMLMKQKSPNSHNSENSIIIPKGSSPFDPIVLRAGYPIVFDYELKEPVRLERIPHGPLRTLHKNGDLKYEFHDGTVRIKTHDGFTYTYYTNGDKQQEFPDGVNAYRYNSNGSVEFRGPDQTLMYFFSNGQIEEHYSNGETRVKFPDRSEVKIFADNSFIFKDKHGNKQKGKIFNEDLKKNPLCSPSSPGSPNEITTPAPRKIIPISTSLASPESPTDQIQTTPRDDADIDQK